MSEPTHYIIRGGVAGRERLRLLGRVMRPTTRNLFERVGIQPALTCLDVGGGGGDVTCELARLVGPHGRVVGIDIDVTKLDLARSEAQAQTIGNVEFRRCDIRQDEMMQGEAELGFDVIYVSPFVLHTKFAFNSCLTGGQHCNRSKRAVSPAARGKRRVHPLNVPTG